MKKTSIVETTPTFVVQHRDNPRNIGIVIMHVDNVLDEQGRVIDFHTRTVDFHGSGFSQREIRDLVNSAKSILDSSNPEAWAQFGNKPF